MSNQKDNSNQNGNNGDYNDVSKITKNLVEQIFEKVTELVGHLVFCVYGIEKSIYIESFYRKKLMNQNVFGSYLLED